MVWHRRLGRYTKKMVRLIASGNSSGQFVNSFTSFLNLDEEPRPIHSDTTNTVSDAWLATGNYLQKAVGTYASTGESKKSPRKPNRHASNKSNIQ